jgi:tripartite-type tricarboxylate transporter receptor subunit TctC
VPGFEASALYGIAAPKRTPAEIVDKLSREINTILADPRTKARIAEVGGEALAGSSAEFGKLFEADAEKWRGVIRAANIKLG